ncbi:MAG: extracellular solute-binding protein [Pseudomonadota bacterium]
MRRCAWLLIISMCLALPVRAGDVLRIFSWDGYVSADDLAQVNRQLHEQKINVRAELISPYAEGPEQMFQILRANRADVSFLTVNYIQMQEGRIARLLQGIDTRRLRNYKAVLPELAKLPMGIEQGQLLYVPFGGGAYGIWANMDRLSAEELPKRLQDLLAPRWKHHLSLTSGQVQPNVALAYMASGEAPFKLDVQVREGQRELAKQQSVHGEPKRFLDALYGQVSQFWTTAPAFAADDLLVASYGPEISGRRALGQNWQLVQFQEGNTVWLDTINLVNGLHGAKLDAAYVFIDHMLSNPVQRRVVEGLSMVAVTGTVSNPLLKDNPDFFRAAYFWPPYTKLSDNLMRAMSDSSMRAQGIPVKTSNP